MKYKCTKCKKVKPESEYFFRERDYRRKQCKACVYKCNRKNYDHEKERFRKIQKRFNLTQEQFNELNEKQKGLCAICGNPPTVHARNRGVLCVDHDHETGKVRALLCRPCNQGLGFFKDKEDLMRKATEYIKSHK